MTYVRAQIDTVIEETAAWQKENGPVQQHTTEKERNAGRTKRRKMSDIEVEKWFQEQEIKAKPEIGGSEEVNESENFESDEDEEVSQGFSFKLAKGLPDDESEVHSVGTVDALIDVIETVIARRRGVAKEEIVPLLID